jgi:hypothetical protein
MVSRSSVLVPRILTEKSQPSSKPLLTNNVSIIPSAFTHFNLIPSFGWVGHFLAFNLQKHMRATPGHERPPSSCQRIDSNPFNVGQGIHEQTWADHPL